MEGIESPPRHAPERRATRSNPIELHPSLVGVASGRATGLDGPARAARPLRQPKKSKIEDFSEVFRAGLDIFSGHSGPATTQEANQCFFIGDVGHQPDQDIPIFSGGHTEESSVQEPERPSSASVPLLPGSCLQAQELGTPVTLTPTSAP